MKRNKYASILRISILFLFGAALFLPSDRRFLITILLGLILIGIILCILDMVLTRFTRKPLSAEKRPDMDSLLWRQISYQITDHLRISYPNAAWDFTDKQDLEQFLSGRPMRIRTFNTADYNFAEISLDRYGRLDLVMMTMESLKLSKVSEKDFHSRKDPESWYNLIGRPALTNIIGDLQAKGHDRLLISETGELYLSAGVPLPNVFLEHFPQKDRWDVLIDILARDELTARKTEGMLELSWTD